MSVATNSSVLAPIAWADVACDVRDGALALLRLAVSAISALGSAQQDSAAHPARGRLVGGSEEAQAAQQPSGLGSEILGTADQQDGNFAGILGERTARASGGDWLHRGALPSGR